MPLLTTDHFFRRVTASKWKWLKCFFPKCLIKVKGKIYFRICDGAHNPSLKKEK